MFKKINDFLLKWYVITQLRMLDHQDEMEQLLNEHKSNNK